MRKSFSGRIVPVPRKSNGQPTLSRDPAYAFLEYCSMAPRATRKGYLRLSLVSCPVLLYPATSDSEKVRFNHINKATASKCRRSTPKPARSLTLTRS
jgi:hypothetical protein